MKSYAALVTDLEALIDTKDPEYGHEQADQILGAALARAAFTQEPPTEDECNHILSAWKSVRKWYA